MPRPEDIEAMLSRLMPPAFSEEGQRSLDMMLDELCGPEEDAEMETAAAAPPVVTEMPRLGPAWKKILIPAGIAAAGALGFLIPATPAVEPAAQAAGAPAAPRSPGIVLVGESDRIEKAVDEGWVADVHGRTMQAVRVRAVEESTFRDADTGILIHVSQPREELVLSPVNEF